MTHEDIIDRAAESIMQRANDTYPRTLHKDMLVDEIGKAVREAAKRNSYWPPAVALGDLMNGLLVYDDAAQQVRIDPVATSHDRMRAKLSNRLSDYYRKPE